MNRKFGKGSAAEVITSLLIIEQVLYSWDTENWIAETRAIVTRIANVRSWIYSHGKNQKMISPGDSYSTVFEILRLNFVMRRQNDELQTFHPWCPCSVFQMLRSRGFGDRRIANVFLISSYLYLSWLLKKIRNWSYINRHWYSQNRSTLNRD